MKRAAVLLLSGLLVLQLAACGNGEEPSSEEEPVESISESESEPEQEPSEPEETPESDSESESEPEPEAPSESAPDIPPEPASQSAPLMNQAAAAPADTGNPFTLDPLGMYALYAYAPSELAYHFLSEMVGFAMDQASYELAVANRESWAVVIDTINSLPTLSTTATTGGTPVGGFMTMDHDNNYKKVQYLLMPGNILEVDGVAYTLTAEQYNSLLGVYQTSIQSDTTQSAQWLVYMNPNRVTKIEATDESGQMQVMPDSVRGLAATEPRYISVNRGSVKTFDASAAPPTGWFQAVYTFDNGVKYYIYAKDDTLRVVSTDMSFGCEYKCHERSLGSYITSTQMALTGMANPRTGKPVIYLYPEKTQDVEVQLDFKGKLYYTFPTYENGWRVTAQPDGTLTNKSDGSTHFYLFWDGTAYKDTWDFSTGFLVKGSETEAFLREKLPLLGLTPREYNDFIVYWVPEMMKNPYNLVTFSTTEYEQVAPLTVTPAPDTVIRVHMIYTPMYEEVEIEEQILPAPPARNGFTVVEWGGTRA